MKIDTLTGFVTRFSPWVEVPEFRLFLAAMEERLAAVGISEFCLASEILHAKWRLRGYLKIDESKLDPAARAELEKCRTRTANMVRRDSADLSREQSERQIREQLGTRVTGLASSRELIEVAAKIRRSAPARTNSKEVAEIESKLHAKIQEEITKGTQSGPSFGSSSDLSPHAASEGMNSGRQTQSSPAFPPQNAPGTKNPTPPGRNTPCPCRSGQKYKRCCGFQ